MSRQDNTPLIRVPAALFAVLSPVVVATRFWSRHHEKSKLGGDDWTILASMLFELADCSVLLAACSFGFGQHAANLTHSDEMMALKLFFCSQILYKISLNLTKVSILLLYLRAFTLRPFRITCWVLMAIVISYGISATIATILQCSPVSRAWDKSLPGTCFDLTAFWFTNAAYTVATDLILLFMPVRIIWGLQLRRAQKIAVLLVFALGGIVTISSIIRMTYIATSSTSNDPTYAIQSTSLANIESNLAILCACLPVYRRPLAKLFPRLFFSLGDSSEHTSQSRERMPSCTKALNVAEKGHNPYEFIITTNPERRNTHNSNSNSLVIDHVEDIEKL